MGCVYWITGLSGAGKTSIGSAFYKKLKMKLPNTVFLDGDVLREVFGNDLGYTREERIKCARRYSKLCKMLQEQDLNVICCTISMFDCIREWNREHIESYYEIYIKVSMEELTRRNQKGLYTADTQNVRDDVAGLRVKVEEPKNPDLVIENEGKDKISQLADGIINHFKL